MKTKVYLNRALLIAGMFFLLQAGASAEERWVKAEYVKNGTVDTGSSGTQLAVRSGPGADRTLTDRLSPGQKVSIYETKNGWIRISSNEAVIPKPAAQERWVNGAYVKKGAVDTGSTSVVLAVRSGPGMDYKLVDNLSSGQKVSIYETKNGWIRISSNEAAIPKPAAQERWVNGAYVKKGAVDTGSASVVLAVRSGPGMDYKMVDNLSPGQKVVSLETRNGWIRIAESAPAVSAAVSAPIKSEKIPQGKSKESPQATAAVVSKPMEVASRPVVQTVVRPPVDNLVLNGDFSGMALALPFPQGNSTAELSGRWLHSSRSAWEISPNGGNLGFYVRAAASAEPSRLLYLAGDDKRSKGQYVLRFDYILTSPSDELGVKVFVSDRDITIGTDGGDFRMNSSQRMSDLVMLSASASWSTYYLPVELGAGYTYVYVLFSGSGSGNTGIDNVSLSPRRR